MASTPLHSWGSTLDCTPTVQEGPYKAPQLTLVSEWCMLLQNEEICIASRCLAV